MLSICKRGIPLAITTWLFPDGTLGVRLDTSNLAYLHDNAPDTTIIAKIQNSNDLMELLLVTDALRRWDAKTAVRLYLPFVTYAQQDRVCVSGEALSIRVMADLINSQDYDRVTIVDPHSEVTPALINRVRVISQVNVVEQFDELSLFIADTGATLVSPDAGANKKTAEIAKYLGHTSYVRCDKRRDLATGKILETLVYDGDSQISAGQGWIKGRTCVIADDICVGGATFLAIAAALKARGAAAVALFVSHGVFSKGTGPLYSGGISQIFTTNSTFAVQPAGVEATVLKLEDAFKI